MMQSSCSASRSKSRNPGPSPTNRMETLGYLWTTLTRVWSKHQVESNGAYSVERLIHLRDYNERVTTTHCVLVLVLTSLPPLLLCVSLESIPLRSTTDGIEHSLLLWVRTSVITSSVIFCFMWPCRFFIPRLPWSTLSTLVAATGAGIISTVGTFGLAYAVGFPLPFTLVCESAIGTVFMCLGMLAIWGSFIFGDRGGQSAFIHHFMLVALQVSMVWIYPAYAYVFNQLSDARQIAAMALLPVIRLLYKNAFAHLLRDLPDLKSCAIVFSADLYHVLFLSWCMNGTTSKKAIVSLMLVDVLEAVIVLHEVDNVLARITSSVSTNMSLPMRVLGYLRSRSSLSQDVRTSSLLVRTRTAMGLLSSSHEWPKRTKVAPPETQLRARVGLACTAVICCRRVKESRVVPADTDPNDDLASPSARVAAPRSATGINAPSSSSSLVDLAVAAHQLSLIADSDVDTAIFHKFLSHSLALLFTTEFVLLIELTEVVIPCIYSLYLLAAYHLPNCVFLSNLHDKPFEEVLGNILALMGYSSLEVVSLIALGIILQRRTRISVLRQLSFVLETHWQLIQADMCLWVILAVQAPLEHYGVDFSFRFEWLKRNK